MLRSTVAAMMRPVRVANHSISQQFALLAVIEFLICIGAVYAAVIMRFQGIAVAMNTDIAPILPKAIVFSSVIIACFAGVGLYYRGFRERWMGIGARLVLAFLISTFLVIAIYYVLPELYLGRGVLALGLGISFLCILAARSLFFWVVDKEKLKRRVLILGAGKASDALALAVRRRSDRRGFRIIGVCPLEGDARSSEPMLKKRMVDLSEKHILEVARKRKIDEIVIAADDRRAGFPTRDLLECKFAGIQVTEAVQFIEMELGKVMLGFVDPSWLILSRGFKHGKLRAGLKRWFDIGFSVVLVSMAWPFMVLSAVAIAIESRSFKNILYRQTRVGYLEKQFELLKFRSMVTDAEGDGVARWAEKNDSRVTRVGRVIRALRIDELPQIFSILKGDMSFVGPRPERPEFTQEFSRAIPYYRERLLVKPGLTGLAQIRYPYGASTKDAVEKLQYDLYYAKNYSLLLDLFVITQTIEVILFGKGVR